MISEDLNKEAYDLFTVAWKSYANCSRRGCIVEDECVKCTETMVAQEIRYKDTPLASLSERLMEAVFTNCKRLKQ